MSATSLPGPELAIGADAEPGRRLEERKQPAGRRPALDGIRALAVLSVIVYHFGGGSGSWLRGGFLGVDIFFVLSGYLITGLLLSEYSRRGGIDLPGFWVRRARRLVPALVVMLVLVSAWVWWASPPESYPARRKDLFWTVGYLANWHFIGAADDYFASYSTASPWRHTWSLAVEEQFYLVWPLLVVMLLWLGHRLVSRRTGSSGGRLLVPLGVAAAVGMALSAWAMSTEYTVVSPSRSYYSTQGRVQELFAGVLLAVLCAAVRRRAHWRPLRPGWMRSLRALAVACAALLVVALFTMSDTAPFYYHGGALLVSLVTAGVIGGVELAPSCVLATGLSWTPAVAVGRISYGLYLWHWPVTVAIPVVPTAALGQQALSQVCRVLVAAGLAGLSYRFVEQPVQRDRRWLRNRWRVLVAVVTSMAVVLGAGVSATALPGTLAQQMSVPSDRTCPGERIDHLVSCVAPAGADPARARPEFALLGDSTARALGQGLDSWAQQTGHTYVEAAWKRCSATGLMVIQNGQVSPDLPATTCTAQAPGLIKAMLARYRPRTVLISEFWAGNLPIQQDGALLPPGTPQHDAALAAAYEKLVDEIASYGGRTVFIGLTPPGGSIGQQVARGRPAANARKPVLGNGRFVAGVNAVFEDVARTHPDTASVMSITDLLCPGGSCPGVIDGTIVRIDGVHYSLQFAQQLAPIVLQRAGIG